MSHQADDVPVGGIEVDFPQRKPKSDQTGNVLALISAMFTGKKVLSVPPADKKKAE